MSPTGEAVASTQDANHHARVSVDSSSQTGSPAEAGLGHPANRRHSVPEIGDASSVAKPSPQSSEANVTAPVARISPDAASAAPIGRVEPDATADASSFSRATRKYLIRLAIADGVVGMIAATLPSLFSNTISGRATLIPVLGLIGGIVWPLAVGFSKGYRRSGVGVGSDELRAVLRAGVAVVVACAFPAGLIQEPLLQNALLKLIVIGTPAAVGLSLALRYVARKRLHQLQASGHGVRRVVVVGSSASARQLQQQLARETYCGMKVVGVCIPGHELPLAVDMHAPVLGDLSQVARVVREFQCDAVAVTSDDATRYNYLRELSWSLEGTGVEMLVDPGLIEIAGPRMHIRPLMGFPLLHVEEPHFTGWRRVVKRTTDIALTSAGLVLISPLLLVVAAVIKLQDGGPVLFKQARVGRDGKSFTMYKFRSMVIDADARKADLMAKNEGHGGLFKMVDDPRITPIGRFIRAYSIDELPQLLNVLNGTMSLVGPRPHLAEELAQMPRHSTRRALVIPGLTGLWQVSGRSDLEGDDAIRLDLRYVENWSLALDLLILWKTASAVLARRGAA